MTEDFTDWIGRSEEAHDVLDPARGNALRASMGETRALVAGEALPPLYHWLYFWNVRPPEGLGPDGHPAKGGFLPPVALPRRMWAGGRLRFIRSLRLGEKIVRSSTIRKVETKSGKSGTLVFVTVEHIVSGESGVAVMEEQDLVYRDAPPAGAAPAPPREAPAPPAEWRETIMPDPVLLFRYSALTMNGHRIHYDRPYAIGEEAYPGLVVQGPLQATMLAGLAARRLGADLATFDFRGMAPAFDGASLHICGEQDASGANLWAEQGGIRTMSARATTI
ncbi:3-methylfumaryl-CoA hydratase [Novosphingobium sp. CF614]|uniref:FAS1-like dehydratase domain-containing protein n=1 Tax=Novosphingobium sp. CF614 TaxID=1884364 RepID=UPI0008DEF458|nr:MaoC family dehydratase N-terminal domain-containing protein [Novosphingobium sp. CF614]SFG22143.1 3-methylfumaryl-CoA hydratase [Novosphingobium sp. CF614]